MNSTIELLKQHRSIRAYQNKALTAIQIDAILASAKSVSSSSFMQCSTIIRITDAEIRQSLADYAGQQHYVIQAAEFWVFCADFNRHYQIEPTIHLEKAEQLLLGCIDTAIMAQNAVIAAESLGLGCVYIGGLRNHIDKVTQLLALPKYTLPLFGVCFGYPDEDPEVKPRLPNELMFFENTYQPLNRAVLAQYDQTMVDYYQHRSSHQKNGKWSDYLPAIVNKEQRDFMLTFLNQQGWITK